MSNNLNLCKENVLYNRQSQVVTRPNSIKKADESYRSPVVVRIDKPHNFPLKCIECISITLPQRYRPCIQGVF